MYQAPHVDVNTGEYAVVQSELIRIVSRRKIKL